MRKFVKQVFLFCLPIIIIFAMPALLMELTNENKTVKKAVEIQKKNNSLIGYGYSQVTNLLKADIVKEVKPDVLVVGSSRAMQFRDYCFKNPVDFYNAAGTVARIKEFQLFFDNTYTGETKMPAVLIMCLDQYYFNPEWDDLSDKPYLLNDVSELHAMKGTLTAILSNKISLSDISGLLRSKSKDVGLTASLRNEGFVSDGSYYYGRVISENDEGGGELLDDCFDRIDNGIRRFEYADDSNNEALNITIISV